MSVKYFLAIDGLNGGSTDIHHVGWFELGAFSFDLSAAPASFPPLDVDLNLNPDVAGALRDISLGTQISSVKLEGVTDTGGQAVYDLTLTNVSLTELHQQGNSGNDSLRFDGYQQVGLITKVQNPDGSFSIDQSFGYDLSTNATIDPTSLPPPTPGSAGGAVPAIAHYFLAIDGLDGGSTEIHHVGWFDLASSGGFSFGVASSPGSDATFSPLEVFLDLNPDVAAALKDIALGASIPSVRLEGVTSLGDAVYDLTLADASLVALTDRQGGQDSLSFDFQQVAVTTKVQSNTGALSPGDSFGFNVATGAEIDATSLAAPIPGSSPGGTHDVAQYFLHIDGLTGGSTDIHHIGWFDVSSFAFAVTSPGPGGTSTFAPLSVTLTVDPGLIGPISNIPSVRLEGVAGITGTAVYDLTLTASSLASSHNSLTFDEYQKVGLLTKIQNPDGSFSAGAGFGFDLTTNTQIDPNSVCFCRGTLILTERGEVAVEHLTVGDRVKTLSGASKPIVWIGVGRDLVTRANKLARPIIVRCGALADGVPKRDLYLTHGHALYLSGVLIPVENLVNHRSIVWDEAARVVEYYHIELEDHDVVLAESAPAESYYDANNRAQFHNTRPGSKPGVARPTFAPVLNGGTVVDAAWAQLFARAGGRIACCTTDDPDLHLVVDGMRLDAARIEGDAYAFALAAAPAGPLRLCSRRGVPSLLGVNHHDHRQLGVALTRIELRQHGMATAVDHDAPLLPAGGAYLAEPGHTWTDGELTLPPNLFAHLTGSFTLMVEIKRFGMCYPSPPAASAA